MAVAGATRQNGAAGPSPPSHHMQQGGEEDGAEEPLMCPVCRAARLTCAVTAAGGGGRGGDDAPLLALGCPRDGFVLDLSAMGLRRRDVRARLAGVYEEHARAGCRGGALAFEVGPPFPGAPVVAMTARCAACGLLRVVV